MPAVFLLQVVLHPATAKNSQIAAFKMAYGDVKLKMGTVLVGAAQRKYTKKKRESGASATVDGLVRAAAADFVAKHSRPSASTGRSVGQSGIAMVFARQGAIGADAKATAAMADMVRKWVVSIKHRGTHVGFRITSTEIPKYRNYS